jgi:hypothetical protein
MLETASFLERHVKQRSIAADWWGTAVDMEYLLDGSSHIVHYQWLDELGSPPVLYLENRKWLRLTPERAKSFAAAVASSGAELALERGTYRIHAAPPLAEGGAPGESILP